MRASQGTSRRIRYLPVCVAALATLAAGLTLPRILYENGVRPPWLEQFYLTWVISSDGLAERAYERLLAGDTARGLALFELGVRRDPASPYRWCDHAEALLAAGQRDRARRGLERGMQLGHDVGPILMRGVNFAYRTGDAAAALKHGRRLLDMTAVYNDAVFAVWDRMGLDTGRVLAEGIPAGGAAQAYLRHAVERQSVPQAQTAWAWILEKRWADDRLADEYARFLVGAGEPQAVVRAWTAWAGAREPGYPVANALFNGGFEREPAGTVFDWRMDPTEGASVQRDHTVAAEGRWSLRLEFDGSQNLEYAHVSQRAAVELGRWRFEARLRTDAISTDEGLGFRIFDPEAPQRLDVFTERLTGTHEWTALAANFVTGPATRWIEVRVVRRASLKFDNKLGGRAWIDAVVLRRP